ncbi:phosphopentomutase [Myxococcota bacterium]|nr:phosphopentomutase [Myxococcota bacterium]MBU1382712.1 phosphopentomutase [Myxococcota bacterium]MBU1496008.1 phosphopentomutase [Myxococcota bacterium]
MSRVLLIVLDSVGAGEAFDAEKYGDVGADTLGHIINRFSENGNPLSLPNLSRWGLSHITSGLEKVAPEAFYGLMEPASAGKDTTIGHWELMGMILDKPFATFPKGFPPEIVKKLERSTGHTFIGNKTASGTEIIAELGEEHLSSGSLILYTSADSVIQIASHEEKVPLDELYRVCKAARLIGDEYKIGRVIARPFTGDIGSFVRTSNRHDYSYDPPPVSVLTRICDAGLPVVGVGKISDIFNTRGVSETHPTKGNTNGIETTLKLWSDLKEGLLFVNLVDFDMLYGHRNNWEGYGRALEEFDAAIPRIEELTKPGDLVMITADHGNDPTFPGTDHNRENVPILAFLKGTKAMPLGMRKTFADCGATCARHLGVEWKSPGVPFF